MTAMFKILSVLLTYPEEEMQAAAGALRSAIAGERVLDTPCRARLVALVDELAERDLMDLQERYVFLFDRTRSLSLHLFEHVHGESRDRGQAMVDLRGMYEAAGLEIAANELPDYLPLFLEFLATQPLDEARALLLRTLHIISAIRERLAKRDSIYAGVFEALESLAAAKPDAEELEALRQAPDDDPGDLQALDRAWAEEPVTFGPGAGSSCPAERLETRLRASIRSVADTQSGGVR
ncbi:MAG: nitrate reductase molybdenum cofactor assembly chaperone [Dongiaceae bacterium]